MARKTKIKTPKTKSSTTRSVDEIDEQVGMQIRARRVLLGLSQMALADVTGVTFQQLQKYERGTNRVSASRLYRISQALDVPIEYLFEASGGKRRSLKSLVSDETMGDDVFEAPETLKLLRSYYAVTDEAVRLRFTELLKGFPPK